MTDAIEYLVGLIIAIGIGYWVDKKFNILKRLDNPFWVILFAIVFTYVLYGSMYVEDRIFSLVTQTEPDFTGCSGAIPLPPGLEKCFFLIPQTKLEFDVMVGKLMSSTIIFLVLYYSRKLKRRKPEQ